MPKSLIWRSFKFGFAVHKFKYPLGHAHLKWVATKKPESSGGYDTVPRRSLKSNDLYLPGVPKAVSQQQATLDDFVGIPGPCCL
jgi:hypothetical protein